jgi:hypothetical protein
MIILKEIPFNVKFLVGCTVGTACNITVSYCLYLALTGGSI